MAKSQDAGLWARFLQWIVGGALDRMDEARESVQRGTKVIVGCPECGTRYSVREKDAGRGLKCPKCNVALPLGIGAEVAREQPSLVPKASPAAAAIAASLPDTLASRGRPPDDAPLPHHLSLTLTVLEGADRGTRLTLGRTRTVLGRREAHICLNDPEISGLHAAITVDGNRYSLQDLQSTNGTFLNGRRIGEAPLAHLDELRLGGTTLLFTVTSNAP